MQELKTRGPNPTGTDSESTSDETLADIEEEEQVRDSTTNDSEGSEIPSPDGAPDEPGETKGDHLM